VSGLDARLHAFRPDLADARLKGRVGAERFTDGELRRVVAPRATVRRSPAPSAMQLTEALFGEVVRIFDHDEETGWAWGQLEGDGYVGWLPAEALAANTPEPTHKVAAVRTLAFGGPDIKQPPLFDLPLGSCVAVTDEAEDRNARYALIAPAGAVVTQHLAPLDFVENDWTAVAERFLGVPYLWGGKTALGIDCSGLVQVALRACGIAAPRDSDMQEAALGYELAGEGAGPDLRRGDLVFWKGHVGIMQDGETLLHGNAYHMAVAVEPLAAAVERLAARGAAVTSLRRLRRE
jgi:cell wall-associated NlpC family hydrolase